MEMEETEGYKNDVIGLKTMNEAGLIKKFTSSGQHLRMTDEEVEEFILPFLI